MSNIIKLDDIEKIVPEKFYLHSDEQLKKTNTEWCMRKYNIDNKIYVTISIRQPNSSKLIYVNNVGEKIIYSIDDKYNQYIVEEKFWYAIG